MLIPPYPLFYKTNEYPGNRAKDRIFPGKAVPYCQGAIPPLERSSLHHPSRHRFRASRTATICRSLTAPYAVYAFSMYSGRENHHRVARSTRNLVLAFLLSALSHVVAMTLVGPGILPASSANVPLRLTIALTPESATVTSPATPRPDPRPVSPPAEQAPEPRPMATTPSPRQPPPEPAARSGKQTPVHHAPATPQTPPTALDSRVATAEPTLSASVSASASISRDVEYLYNPPPGYPPRARRMGMEGEVLIRTRVLRNGRCDELELVQSSGYALLDRAAMEAIRKWRFRPALRGDEQVSSRIEIPVRFRLDH